MERRSLHGHGHEAVWRIGSFWMLVYVSAELDLPSQAKSKTVCLGYRMMGSFQSENFLYYSLTFPTPTPAEDVPEKRKRHQSIYPSSMSLKLTSTGTPDSA